MLSKQVTTLLLATAFCTFTPVSSSWSQSKDLRCSNPDTLVDVLENCEDTSMEKKLEVDPTITNSIDTNSTSNNNASKSNASNDKSTNSDNNDASSADDSGATTGSSDDGDHDNGHGNDADHDDGSNPGQGGGNHGAGK